MLSKKYRFHSRGGVKYTYKHGKTIRTPKISLVYNENARGHIRCAVVVSKKVEKTAVARNRIRRRVYEAIRLELPNFPEKRDYIFVIYASEIMTIDFDELRKLIHSLFAQCMV